MLSLAFALMPPFDLNPAGSLSSNSEKRRFSPLQRFNALAIFLVQSRSCSTVPLAIQINDTLSLCRH